ncbi:MAG: hypothetical protein HY540_00760 [Deltaproteobacteria bacterium]|nr:hypothetical protein [Deltaproteobacteria bacterium]
MSTINLANAASHAASYLACLRYSTGTASVFSVADVSKQFLSDSARVADVYRSVSSQFGGVLAERCRNGHDFYAAGIWSFLGLGPSRVAHGHFLEKHAYLPQSKNECEKGIQAIGERMSSAAAEARRMFAGENATDRENAEWLRRLPPFFYETNTASTGDAEKLSMEGLSILLGTTRYRRDLFDEEWCLASRALMRLEAALRPSSHEAKRVDIDNPWASLPLDREPLTTTFSLATPVRRLGYRAKGIGLRLVRASDASLKNHALDELKSGLAELEAGRMHSAMALFAASERDALLANHFIDYTFANIAAYAREQVRANRA